MSITEAMQKGAKRAAYSAGQMARIGWYTGHYIIGRRKMGPLSRPGEAPFAGEFRDLDRGRLTASFRELFKKEWRHIESGDYKLPAELRRPPALGNLLKLSRDYFRDAGEVARRKNRHGHSEVMESVDVGVDTDDADHNADEKYPRYYLQNFHYQTDGWLTDESAERYDMQVETLFTGAAAAMRRQALPLIKNALADRDPQSVNLVDFGCGTGVFLKDVLYNWPLLNTTALDLSPAYLGKTQNALSAYRNVRYVRAAAEDTGLPTGSADIVTAVYLFHELPPKVRRAVVKEAARLLKPGGAFILVDTIQYGDEPGLDILLENFPRGFHEPYYDSYCREELASLGADAALEKTDETLAFLTKATVFRKAIS